MKKPTLHSVLYRRIPIAPVVCLLVLIATFVIAPLSKLFLAVAIAVGMFLSLVSMEELTGGGNGLSAWLSLALILIAGSFANSVFFEGTSKAQRWALMFQFTAAVFLTESLVIILFRSRFKAFMAQRKRR